MLKNTRTKEVLDSNSSPLTRFIDGDNPWLTVPTPSCIAVKQALYGLFRIDDFSQELIGSGFFSQVFKVVHTVTNQVLVLKVNTQLSNRCNVLREIQLLSQLSHQNIIRLCGVCVSGGQLHALIEYINGGNLEQLIADKSVELPWSVRIRLACDIAKGLKYMHCNGVMHRDLTSKNILIKKLTDGRLSAVVADLGLAASIPDPRLNKCLPSVGSPYWMAPECIRGYKYNEKADVFSYGIILCELVARICADPEILPRTSKFGVDYVAFSKMASNCPLHFLHLTFICCQIDSGKRPSSSELVNSLEMMKYSALMEVMLADLGRNSDRSINRAVLEDILDVKRHRRTHSDLHKTSDAQRYVVPVTPLTIGQVMSEDDIHYAPHSNNNPFVSCFLPSAVKVVNGCQLSATDPDAEVTEPRQLEPRRVTVSRSYSLPSSPSLSRDSGAVCCGTIDSGDEATSSIDGDVIAKCIDDLFDDDDISLNLTDDSSSMMSLTVDDVAVLQSPTRTLSYNVRHSVDQCELSSSFWHERFQRLLTHWQTRQLDVNSSRLSPRLRLAVPHLVQRFAELRRAFEENKVSSSTSVDQTTYHSDTAHLDKP